MIEAPADTYARIFSDPRVEQTQQAKELSDARDQIIANLSIENEVLKNRLKEYASASKEIRDALYRARDQFARLRDGYFY